jgi:hypothetical protein
MQNSYTRKIISQRQNPFAQSSSSGSLDQQQSPRKQAQHRRASYQPSSVDNPVQYQGRDLIEQWPQRVTSGEHKDTRILPSASYKAVSFSPHSLLHTYDVDESERLKSYSSSEQTQFQVQALHNALWIQDLIQSCPYKGGTAIHYLIERNLIRPEELLGIENLIVGGRKILNERRAHSRLVLKTQSELKKKKDVNIGQKLSDVAASRSLKNVEKARLRAVLAA